MRLGDLGNQIVLISPKAFKQIKFKKDKIVIKMILFWNSNHNVFVKIEKYIKYDDIFEAIESGNDNGLEAMIKQIIEDYEEDEEE